MALAAFDSMTRRNPAAGTASSVFSSPALAAALFAALALFALAAFAPQVLNDSDTYWHISAGHWMLSHHAVLRADPFSYTMAGQPWDTQEWFAEIAMALAYGAAGWSGIMVLTGACAAAMGGLFVWWLSRWLSGTTLLAVAVLGLACVSGSLLARPHLLALPLLVIWTGELVAAREEKRAPSLWLWPVMALWANLHGSFAIGLALAGALALEALIKAGGQWRAVLRGWLIFGLGAGCASLLTPQGINGLLFPIRLMGMHYLGAIGEWQPSDLTHLEPFTIAILAMLFVFASGKVRIPAFRMLLVLGFLFLAVQHARHQMLFGLIVPLLLAPSLGLSLTADNPFGKLRMRAMAIGAIAAVVLLIAARIAIPMSRADSANSPIAALAHVPAKLAQQPVLNDYSFGGYLIFRGVKPFVDSRADLYGDKFLANYAAIKQPDRAVVLAALKKYRVQWTLLPPGAPLTALIETLPGWKRLYAGKYAIVDGRQN